MKNIFTVHLLALFLVAVLVEGIAHSQWVIVDLALAGIGVGLVAMTFKLLEHVKHG